MVDLKHWIPILFVCLICLFCATEALNPDGTCSNNSDCPFSYYHCCTGTKWCCPTMTICTGTSTCIGIGYIIGPIIGLVVLTVCIVVVCICRNRKQRTPGVVYNSQTTTQPGNGVTNPNVWPSQPEYGLSNPAYGQMQPPQYSVQPLQTKKAWEHWRRENNWLK